MNEDYAQLKREVEELRAWKQSLEASYSIPLNIEQSLLGRGFLKSTTGTTGILAVSAGGTGVATLTGIPKGSGTSAFTAITPLSGAKVYYVSDSSGGVVNRKLTFTDGVLTGET